AIHFPLGEIGGDFRTPALLLAAVLDASASRLIQTWMMPLAAPPNGGAMTDICLWATGSGDNYAQYRHANFSDAVEYLINILEIA
ncbi:MAG: hypothetical protein O7A03_08110, partial [Alphaproteobacteria bacterium]|nr:hypothetical protein [Alphaproteobacteria bacterium]